MYSCVHVDESQALFDLEPCLACAQANHMIRQEFEFVAEGDKFARLVRLLEREMDGSRLLVFCETKRGCDAVTRQLRQSGWPALSIHGDKSQEERDWVLSVRPKTLSHFHTQRCILLRKLGCNAVILVFVFVGAAGPRCPLMATRAERSDMGAQRAARSV